MFPKLWCEKVRIQKKEGSQVWLLLLKMVYPNSLKNCSTYQMNAAIKAVKLDSMSMSCTSKIHSKYNHIQRPANWFLKQINWLASVWMKRFLDEGNTVNVCYKLWPRFCFKKIWKQHICSYLSACCIFVFVLGH